MRLSTLALLAGGLALQACSAFGPAGPTPGTDGPDEPPAATYPAYESFDPTGYDADPMAAPAEVVHDVPARVMEGRVEVPDPSGAPAPASEPVARQVDGYRVQIFTSASRDTAERIRGEAVSWWERAQSAPGAPASMEVMVGYQQPYYRVRMGAFASREEADRALALVRQRYPEAFLVPDLVTVTQ